MLEWRVIVPTDLLTQALQTHQGINSCQMFSFKVPTSTSAFTATAPTQAMLLRGQKSTDAKLMSEIISNEGPPRSY